MTFIKFVQVKLSQDRVFPTHEFLFSHFPFSMMTSPKSIYQTIMFPDAGNGKLFILVLARWWWRTMNDFLLIFTVNLSLEGCKQTSKNSLVLFVIKLHFTPINSSNFQEKKRWNDKHFTTSWLQSAATASSRLRNTQNGVRKKRKLFLLPVFSSVSVLFHISVSTMKTTTTEQIGNFNKIPANEKVSF